MVTCLLALLPQALGLRPSVWVVWRLLEFLLWVWLGGALRNRGIRRPLVYLCGKRRDLQDLNRILCRCVDCVEDGHKDSAREEMRNWSPEP